MTTPQNRITSSIGDVVISGSPSAAEVAAIVAAIEAVWPKPLPAITRAASQSTVWRYAGRWWSEGRLPSRWS